MHVPMDEECLWKESRAPGFFYYLWLPATWNKKVFQYRMREIGFKSQIQMTCWNGVLHVQAKLDAACTKSQSYQKSLCEGLSPADHRMLQERQWNPMNDLWTQLIPYLVPSASPSITNHAPFKHCPTDSTISPSRDFSELLITWALPNII